MHHRFLDCCSDTGELTETMTEYMKFCEVNVATKETVRVYPDNKTEASAEMRRVKERTAFINGDLDLVKIKTTELSSV